MKHIYSEIEFFSDWHCGSGLSAGANLAALVIKDKNGLPFVPGKTIKGLVREAVESLQQLAEQYALANINEAFGFFDNKDDNQKGCLFFTNAELSKLHQKAIVSNNATKYLYRTISSTSIDENGIAKAHSLRKMEVVVPCTLLGEIMDVPDEIEPLIIDGLRFIKRLGQNRNRGLGRCQITIKKGGVQ